MPLRTIQADIDEASFQTALNRATQEGKTIGQIVAEFLQQYAQGAAAGAPTSYTVQRGDTLGRIAQKVYGDARKYPLIQKANNLSDPSRIWVGQVLIIPSVAGSTPATIPTSAPLSPPTTPFVITTPATPPAPVVTLQPTRTCPPPPKPSIEWVGSPNFNKRHSAGDITGIVIHATANSTLQGVIDWFNNPNAQVSAHYAIDKDGRIAQHVLDSDRAWHAGQSAWRERNSCNDFTIGVELVNLNDGQDPYPETQHQTNVALCAYLCYTYNIQVGDIVGHLDVALPLGRKTDPRNYDLNRLRREVAMILGDTI